MSISKKLSEIPLALREAASKDLSIEVSGNSKYGGGRKQYINIFHVEGGEGYFPYNYARTKLNIPTRLRIDYPMANIIYKTEEYPLREEQLDVKSKAINALNRNGCCILSLYTGFGKTCLSIYLASRLKLKTLYINNRVGILDQIVGAVKQFSHSRVQLLNSKSSLDATADFYVINAINVPKLKKGSFLCIGTLIVDEIHCMLSQVLSRSLNYVTPRYLIGLSATPYRDDGMNELFDLYFGPEKIHIPLYRKHTVYRLVSPLVPSLDYTSSGTLNWGGVLNEQAGCEGRNEKIIQVLQKFGDRVFMVICKRVSQIVYLEKRLKEVGESFDSLHGGKREYDRGARILIGTSQKMGVGFDHPRINALLLAADFEAYFIQTLGRSMRTPEVEPIIIDIVDNNSLLKKHWKTRARVYIEHGGTIKGLEWGTLGDKDLGAQSLLQKEKKIKKDLPAPIL